MGGLKTYLAPLLAALVLTSGAAALPFSPSQRAELFANCAGRLSALEEHQRMFDGAASEITRDRLRYFETLIEAVMPDAIAYGMPGRQVLSWRLAAKLAQSSLLQRATFGQDALAIRNAKQASEAYIAECTGLMARA